jgi:hypothetical protein
VRGRAGWEIFEVMMANDEARMVLAHADPSHPCVAIGIGEVNIASEENFLVIGAARRNNECAQNEKLEREQSEANNSHKIDNGKSPIENRK